ncbi:MAG: hypothetical protein E4H25_07830 [Methanomassiliicoccus sp.]|nr:MAG: hypothetical protein E4H25_07830 [Methanomassiliicoccus sp.]
MKFLSRIMQTGMVAIALVGIITANYTWVPAALISLAISTIPAILRKDLRLVLPLELNFWIVIALFLHVAGGFSGFYDSVPGWDHLTHAMSSSLIAALAFVVVVALDKYSDRIFLPRPFLAMFISMFTMAIGVVWELMEYANDKLSGSHLQYSLSDTMVDLFFDALAGLIVAIVGAYYLTYTSKEHFIDAMQIDQAKEKMDQILGSVRQRK